MMIPPAGGGGTSEESAAQCQCRADAGQNPYQCSPCASQKRVHQVIGVSAIEKPINRFWNVSNGNPLQPKMLQKVKNGHRKWNV